MIQIGDEVEILVNYSDYSFKIGDIGIVVGINKLGIITLYRINVKNKENKNNYFSCTNIKVTKSKNQYLINNNYPIY